MQRFLIFLFGFVAVVSAAIAINLLLENKNLRVALAEERRSSLEAEPEPEVDSESGESGEPVAEGAQTDVVAAPGTAPERSPRGGRFERFAESMGRMLSDPESRAAMLTRMKSRVDRTYGDLFVSLGLDEVEAEALRTLLAERQMAQMEAGMLMRTAETDEEREEARLWRDAKIASLDSGLESVLGPDAGTVLRDYTESAPIRNSVDEVARRASYVGAPMTQEQSSQLVSVIQNVGQEYPLPSNQPDGSNDMGAGGGGRRGRDSVPVTQEYVDEYLAQLKSQNAAVLAASSEFLNEQQREALADKQIESFEATQQQLNFSLRNPDIASGGFMRDRGRGPAGGPGGGPGRGP